MTVQTSSHIVPSLDLHSEDNLSSANDYMQDCKCNNTGAEAYITWLSAKRKLLSDKAARLREVEEEKRLEKIARKRLAEEKFKEWLELKRQQQEIKTYEENEKDSSHTYVVDSRSQISAEEARARVEEWTQKKIEVDERRREMKREEEARRKQWEKQRRNMSAEAWKAWIAEAANKPKPVPLNRGIFTLRGTISDIYVNPNEWQPLIPETQ